MGPTMVSAGVPRCDFFSWTTGYISRQRMYDIHAYTHPQWCQRGCHFLPWIFPVCLDVLRCTTLVCRRCATFMRTRTPNGVSGGAIFCHGFFLCAWMCSAALHEYADDAPHSYVYAPLMCR